MVTEGKKLVIRQPISKKKWSGGQKHKKLFIYFKYVFLFLTMQFINTFIVTMLLCMEWKELLIMSINRLVYVHQILYFLG